MRLWLPAHLGLNLTNINNAIAITDKLKEREVLTMKKCLIVFISLLLTLSLAACGGGSNTPPAPPSSDAAPIQPSSTPSSPPSTQTAPSSEAEQPSDVPEGQAMASLIGWMMDGTFSYDFTMTSESPDGTTEGSGSMAIDGENMAMTMEMTVQGQAVKSRMIKQGDTMYVVDDASKMIMEMPTEMTMTEGMMTDYSGITKTGDGIGDIDGKTLPYEEYTESETGAIVRYYLDGGQVYAMESDYEGYKTIMIITNPSSSVPAGAFDLPEGYTKM